MPKDLVCGMEVDVQTSPFVAEHKRTKYFFCCKSCQNEFERNPEHFIVQHPKYLESGPYNRATGKEHR
jgi:YHS domain-containing protein